MVPFDPSIRGSWGPPINAAWNAVEQLAAGNGSIDLTGLTSYSVTVANDATDQARQAMLPFTGTVPSSCTVTVPPISRIGWVSNGTNFPLIMTAGGTVNLTVPVGMSALYTVTGSAVTAVPVGFPGDAQIGGTLTVAGTLTVVTGKVFFNAGLSVSAGGGSVYGGLGVNGGLSLDFGRLFAKADPATNINTIYATPNVLGRGNVPFNGLHISTSAGVPMLSFTDTSSAGGVFSGPASATAFTVTSDRRGKTAIADITSEAADAWVRNGRPRTYLVGDQTRAGFIAQEDIDSGRSAAVRRIADDRAEFAVSDGYAHDGQRLVRDYNHDIAYLTKALATALDRIDALEAARGV